MAKPVTLRAGYRHIDLDNVISTNSIAYEHFENGDPGKLWITAIQQSGGKGSRGRNWVSVPGNLYASLLLISKLKPDRIANLSFIASLALHDALKNYLPEDSITLKWPNDVLINGKKISGILLENHPCQNGKSGVIIGIGVNCNSHPTDTTHTATDLKELGKNVAPLELFQHLAANINKYLEIWDEGNNFGTIRQLWLDKAQGVGEKIFVKMPKQEVSGIFERIDEQGLLILKTTDNNHQRISTADIFFSNSNQKSA